MSTRPHDADPAPESTAPETAAPASTAPANTALATLRCEGLSKRFGGLAAVDDVSISVPDRGLFGLCGPNGAGKSTFFNLLAGAIRADAGKVWLREKEITRYSVTQRSRLGIGRTWQAVRLVLDRTVLDNVAVSCARSISQPMWGALFRTDYAASRQRAAEVLDSLGLSSFAGQLAGQLTLEVQRMVEVARAMADDPAIVLADEPASGLSKGQRRVLADLLTEVAKSRPVLVVEHDLDMLARISELIYAMVNGRLIFAGQPADFLSSEAGRSLRGLNVSQLPR